MFNSKYKEGFTLAEVLITLGVIGIIAALTIPTLVQNYQKNQTLTQLKSVYSMLNNALDMSKPDNGTNVNNWYVPSDSEANASTYFAENYLLPYLKTSSTCGTNTSGNCLHRIGYLTNKTSPTKTFYNISGTSNQYSFILLNGAIVCVHVFNMADTAVGNSRVTIYVDVNGKKQPNIMGNDVFLIELGGFTSTADKNKFWPYAYNVDYTRNDYLTGDPGNNCDKVNGNGNRCFALIMRDNWQIADDYPWD